MVFWCGGGREPEYGMHVCNAKLYLDALTKIADGTAVAVDSVNDKMVNDVKNGRCVGCGKIMPPVVAELIRLLNRGRW